MTAETPLFTSVALDGLKPERLRSGDRWSSGIRWFKVAAALGLVYAMSSSSVEPTGKVMYCRPQLDTGGGRACHNAPSHLTDRLEILVDGFMEPDPRVGRPDLIEMIEAILPDEPVVLDSSK